MRRFQFVDVSGLGNSGKGAVVDFLREFGSLEASEYSFEFDLFRLPNGIVDLHYHLAEDWTPIRSNAAILSFLKLAKTLGGSHKKKNLRAFLFSAGTGYEYRFNNRFYQYSQEYVESFIQARYRTFWPYYLIDDSPWTRLWKKVLIKFNIGQERLRSPVILADGSTFSAATTEYINKLFHESTPPGKTRVVLNNVFEPFNPVRSLNLLNDSKCILVIRDPRDVYVSGRSAKEATGTDVRLMASDNNGINKSFLGTDNLEIFVKRQKLYFDRLYAGNDPRVRIVRFEDFVLDAENETRKIMDFLGLDEKDHSFRREFFNPEKSAKNIGNWKKYSNSAEIEYIEKNLKDYCYDHDKR